ncbi:hypothetical protein [Ekhidna sp.]|uniref:hypothetical protein n=1 Tax=Ekhidna sp. TaxID=2608089 RepID=UPI003B512977
MDLSKVYLSGVLFLASLSISAQMAMDNVSATVNGVSSPIEDLTAPRTDLLRTETGDFIYGPATRIKFKIVEEESGVATTYFKVADHPYMKSDGRQMMPHDLADGSYNMKYYSTDNEGNQEPIRAEKIFIDKTGPAIRSGFSTTPNSFDNGLPVFSKDVNLAIDVKDDKVKVQKVTVSINEGPQLVFKNTENIDLTEYLNSVNDDHIIIEIRAYDTFYNLSKEVVEFKKSR